MPESLSTMIERNLRAQALLPAQRPLVELFARSLAKFKDSNAKFEVICTAPSLASKPSDPSKFLGHGSVLPAPIAPAVRPKTLVVLDSSFNPPTIAHLRMATSAIRDLGNREGTTGDNRAGNGSTLRLLLLLAVNNADKAPKPAAFEQRLAMMWALARDIQHALSEPKQVNSPATEQNDVAVDVGLSTQPYFTDKSAAIAEADFYHGQDSQDGTPPEQVILAGYDTLIRIFNPKYYGTPDGSSVPPIQRALGPFFARARLLVTMRTDDEWGGREDQLAYLEDLVNGDSLQKIGGSAEWAGRVEMVEGRSEGEDVVSSTLAREAAKHKDWETLEKLVTPEVKEWIEKATLYGEDS